MIEVNIIDYYDIALKKFTSTNLVLNIYLVNIQKNS